MTRHAAHTERAAHAHRLWALQAAPLIIGADLSQIDEFTTNLLGNPEVQAVSRDSLGRRRVAR
ncbi:MAG TPA: hypothetical protein VHV78_10725 [Gemmatimonadaceae bacterium]|nr:hypothetical protein [Gemmatimonadaceae bacterium]